ncbi:secretion system type I outer membrane efflux pump lipoprotein NodT [Ameyamaea chiangmaiensis NBRC 103196]|uniref:Efflux transporter outer membrane subunit n=1 Tax=Ameyamaea chiangmaiensis TaxID=442969 RepID=A0A850P737_9PROT|nr:efflux transporter outer membrane subunit [Ameyamaea chiangmaiensis]MBS4075966.1 efflux transporter outer membrane subunit [Ameyamaea chiangmaiensis]NVN39748.1 efflux transporter outer membrane subunit [Ameyamaea chiangmaiensis]GBQ61590.1 secretion system type I outer membrane efflux pump lipoprotein NodT [Ameyamaea chiangmaiensis NBRC 103196]
MSTKTVFRAAPLLLAALSGCTLIPTYHRPQLPVSGTYPAGSAYRAEPKDPRIQAADLGWEDFFTDARLRALIALALRENRDLLSAATSIEQAQAQYQIQNASLFPALGVTGQGLFEAPSNNAGFSFAPVGGSTISTLKYYSTGFGFSSYELDLFGRIRSLTREAREQELSQAENARSVMISTISQVANAYITWLADREQLRITNDTLASQGETLRLTRLQFDHGAANQLTLRQVETQVEQAQANKAQYERAVAQDENALVLLVGAPLPADLPPPAPFGSQTMMTDLPAGLPSDLLERRPDILSAEHTLKAANADIGAARANFFPKITLTANDGQSSRQFRSLFTPGGQTWIVNPQIDVPIFTWGQATGNLHYSKAKRAQDVRAYEKAIQTAFRETSDALAARSTYLDQDERLRALVASASDGYQLAMMRYHEGTDSYLTALDSQRTLYQAQQGMITVQAARYENLVTLYRVLGGGWKNHTLPPGGPHGGAVAKTVDRSLARPQPVPPT